MATSTTHRPLVELIVDFEEGNLGLADTLYLFGELIQSGFVWQLQGRYGRTAHDLIAAGYITGDGELTDAAWIDEDTDCTTPTNTTSKETYQS